MPTILNDFSVKELNTFGLDVLSKYYCKFTNEQQLRELFSSKLSTEDYIVVGKGSNLLFTKDFDGLILQCGNSDIYIKSATSSSDIITAYAGLEWDSFVDWCVKNNFWGLENLSYIPGTVGAAPVQNIGAYGVEVSEFIYAVTYFDPSTLSTCTIGQSECRFGYRDSIFKHELSHTIVLSVDFKISRIENPRLHYKDLRNYIDDNQIPQPLTLEKIRTIITNIRKVKLPDPEKIGNGGSFFKNPVIDNSLFSLLKSSWPDMPYYELTNHEFKIPAAWLIDTAGWKGFRTGDAGVHIAQPLVLVNYGKATGLDILKLSDEIVNSILLKFGIKLDREIIVL